MRLNIILFLLAFYVGAWAGPLGYAPADYVSGTLPVLHIDVADDDYIEVKEPYRQATCWMEDTTGSLLMGSPDGGVAVQVKGHGNVTFTELAKKPLRLKFDKKQSLLGLNRSKHFVLLPHADDHRAMVKDELGFELSRQLGMPWTPRQRPVELVLNGDYWGLYFLCEKIRVENGRVDIEEQADGETDPELVTGGWLLEIDNYTADEEQVIMTAWNDRMFRVTVHSPDSLSDVQRDYITDLMHRTNEAFYDVDINSGQWEQLVDLDSLALFYLCNEMVDNYEAFSGSCWFYKRRGEESRLIFGPVWDFGNALERVASGLTMAFIYDTPRPWWAKKVWIEAAVGCDRFNDAVNHYFFDYCHSERLALTLGHMRDFVGRIVVAGRCDHLRWPDVPNNALQYRERICEAAFLKKVNWLAEQWNTGGEQCRYGLTAARVEGVRGDADGNGVVDVNDVNKVINLILYNDGSANKGIDVSYLNMVINVILGKDGDDVPDPEGMTTYSVNGVSFNMVNVEGGTYTMGATAEQNAYNPYYDELPTHSVTLGDYAIGQTEVTQELWQAVMGTNPSHFTGNLRRPVESVSWNDCQEFIARLNELTGKQFRLPTEAEWEYAARGRDAGRVYAGDNVVGRVAWYDANACSGVSSSSASYGTHAVSTKARNKLKLCDMSGNVWEWCADWYAADSYNRYEESNPQGPATGSFRVLRGGGWDSYAWSCRVSARDFCAPWLKFNNIGFRLAL